MLLKDFKLQLAAYLRRDLATLSENGADLALMAINQARLKAQRDHNFESFERQLFIDVSLAGTDFRVCKDAPAGSNVAVKLIKRAWSYTTSGAYYVPTARIRFNSRTNTRLDYPTQSVDEQYVNQSTDVYLYRQGFKLFLAASPTSTTIMVDAIEFKADLVGTESSDFFLDYAHDWLLFATANSLNAMLKEDQRVAVSQSALAAAWQSVIDLDAQIAVNDESINLD